MTAKTMASELERAEAYRDIGHFGRELQALRSSLEMAIRKADLVAVSFLNCCPDDFSPSEKIGYAIDMAIHSLKKDRPLRNDPARTLRQRALQALIVRE